MNRLAIAILIALAAFAGCRSAPEAPPRVPVGQLPEAGAGDPLVEQAFDGRFTVPAGERATVDANSDLVLAFGTGAPTPDEQVHLLRVREALDRVVAAGRERAQILTELGPLQQVRAADRDPAQVSLLATRSADLAKGARSLLAELTALGFSEPEVDAAIDRAPAGGEGAFAALGALLAGRQQALVDRAKERAATTTRLEVAVQAFLDSAGNERRQLHVENYDTLPAGEYRPIQRFSLEMTPAERQRFRAGLHESQLWADALRALQRDSLRPGLTALRDELAAFAAAAPEQLAAQLRQALDGAQLAADVRTRLGGLLDAVLAKVQVVRAAAATWRSLLPGDAATIDLLAMFDRLQAALQQTAAAVTAVRELPAAVQALLADAALPVAVKGTAETGLAAVLARAKTGAPVLAGLAAAATKVLGWSLAGGAPAAPAAVPPEVWHALDEAPEARVELASAGLTTGDSVLVKALYRTPGAEHAQRVSTYKVDAELMGWHRQISPELTFARADTGPGTATDWQPGVAAVADLHYRWRDGTGLRAFWNFVDPALGVHLASLSQTDETTEFGMGANLSCFAGFLTGGVGWNFSAESGDGLYYFVAIDLMTVLQQAQGGGS